MTRRQFFVDAPPAPKPISAARWLPVARKRGMWIDFENNNVTVGAGTPYYFSEFWGDCFSDKDVGALVLRVAKVFDGAKAAAVQPAAPGDMGAPI